MRVTNCLLFPGLGTGGYPGHGTFSVKTVKVLGKLGPLGPPSSGQRKLPSTACQAGASKRPE